MNIFIVIFFLFINFFLIYFFERISNKLNIFDSPNSIRKIHTEDIAAIGGIIIFFNITLYLIFSYFLKLKPLITMDYSLTGILSFYLPLSLIFFLGIFDDKYEISAKIKFVLQIIIVSLALFLNNDLLISNIFSQFINLHIDNIIVRFVFTLICLLAFLNAFNMFDGINLQSSSYALILILILCIRTGYHTGDIVLLISILAFMYLNFLNKCFLGDNGSLMLAFLISYILVLNYNAHYIIRADEIFLMLMIPVLDLLRLLILRTYNKTGFYTPDREHLHHLLNDNMSLISSIITINFIIILPLIFFYLGVHSFICILISTITYLLILFYSKKKKSEK